MLGRCHLKQVAVAVNITRRKLLSAADAKDYDLVVIGGGSGGLACAKEAAAFGARVAVLDYVTPSIQGSAWGLGGTCVNVGCIPKKLMHHAALLGEGIQDSKSYGWKVPEEKPDLDWSQLMSAVQSHIKSLNWGHRVQLNDKNVTYLNAKGKLLDPHTIAATDRKSKVTELKGSNIVVATGGRPKMPNSFALELAVKGEGFVVVLYDIALECAGFLTGLGFDTSLLIRSTPLRGFDQDMAKLIVRNMERHGTKVHYNSSPMQVQQLDNGRRNVFWQYTKQKETEETGVFQEDFDTVLFATGRGPDSEALGLDTVNIETDPESGKVIVDKMDATTIPHIYCIGDAAYSRPELTPVAIKAGKLLSRRLFGNSVQIMDYDNVPTTVFTPMEYGCVGLSTERATNQFGSENVEIYHAFYHPLELTIPPERESQLLDYYLKTVCVRDLEKDDDRVVGIHFLGPNAGEVIQGFAVAMRTQGGLPMTQITSTVGIHPTNAEELVKLNITKSSGQDPVVTGC